MSAENKETNEARDLDLTPEDADRVKGGVLPIDGGAGGTSYIPGTRKKHKKRKKSGIGPYEGKH